ncbi:MAG: FeoB-associated Cys-rich membrane protein [Oscillibacter sp.]|nr:FeoB-associated Cys-rich membrane protein [Oscillibacter sp.]
MVDLIIIAVLAVVIAASAGYVYKAKKRGVKCIGCPAGGCGGCHEGGCGCGGGEGACDCHSKD